jgi:hypothetical protein
MKAGLRAGTISWCGLRSPTCFRRWKTRGLCKPSPNQEEYLPSSGFVRGAAIRGGVFFAKRKPRLHPPSVSCGISSGPKARASRMPRTSCWKRLRRWESLWMPRESRLVYISRRTSGFSRPRRCRKTGCVSILAVLESMSSTSKSRGETGAQRAPLRTRSYPKAHTRPLRNVAVCGI